MAGALRHWLRSGAVTTSRGDDGTVTPLDFAARVQVKPGHYGPQYESARRWVNYGAQVREDHPQTNQQRHA